MNTITVSVSLDTIVCPDCSGAYAISSAFRAEALSLGDFKKCWHCPYCDSSRGYGESAHEKEVRMLRGQLAYQISFKESAQRRAQDAEAEAEHFRKSLDGMKGALVKTQTRVKNGVCPCCTRSFSNLAAHMATKHPKYACEKVVAPPA